MHLITSLSVPCRLAAIGLGVGLGLSWATGYLLRLVRWRGARPYVETTIVMGLSYLSFYVANSPAKVSLSATDNSPAKMRLSQPIARPG